MPTQLTDQLIASLLGEPKPMVESPDSILSLKAKSGHKERDIDLQGAEGSHFRLVIRQSSLNAFDFSVILGYHIPNSNTLFRLRRYNGNSHFHTNRLESNRVGGFHIHSATERYQHAGLKEDGFAEPTTRYFDLKSALTCMFQDCGFLFSNHPQLPWF